MNPLHDASRMAEPGIPQAMIEAGIKHMSAWHGTKEGLDDHANAVLLDLAYASTATIYVYILSDHVAQGILGLPSMMLQFLRIAYQLGRRSPAKPLYFPIAEDETGPDPEKGDPE